MFALEPSHSLPNTGPSAAATAQVIRHARVMADRNGVIEPSKAVTAAEGATNEAPEKSPPPENILSVDLIPGSNRLVTTVMDPARGVVLYRIPAWLSDLSDIEAAIGNHLPATYL